MDDARQSCVLAVISSCDGPPEVAMKASCAVTKMDAVYIVEKKQLVQCYKWHKSRIRELVGCGSCWSSQRWAKTALAILRPSGMHADVVDCDTN